MKRTVIIELSANERLAVENLRYEPGCLEHTYFWLGLLSKRNVRPLLVSSVETAGASATLTYHEAAPTAQAPNDETLADLYRIHAGLSGDFRSSEVPESRLHGMQRAHRLVLDWGRLNGIDPHGDA